MDEALCLLQVAADEMASANLMLSIVIEELLADAYLSTPFHLRPRQEVPMTRDDYLKDAPVFLLNVRKNYRIRISLKHRHRSHILFRRIRLVKVKPLDGLERDLHFAKTVTDTVDHEVVALFVPTCHRSAKLNSVSPSSGDPDEKYVKLKISVDLATETQPPRTLDLRGELFCKMVAHDNQLRAHRLMRTVERHWRTAPQWIRTAAKGAVIFAKEVIPAALLA